MEAGPWISLEKLWPRPVTVARFHRRDRSSFTFNRHSHSKDLGEARKEVCASTIGMAKMKLVIKIFPLSSGPVNALYGRVQPPDPKSFLLPVKPTEKFAEIWKRAAERYRDNYTEGRRE